MTGKEYLEGIKTELAAGRHQRRMGEKVLRAFGYVRRRATAIEDINATLDELELVADPPITSDMPLKTPLIRFSIKNAHGVTAPETLNCPNASDPNDVDAILQDVEYEDSKLSEPAFSVSELASANQDVKCVPPDASIEHAYTKMVKSKYSQLVVASTEKPRQTDIKGIVSFQSMAKALMNGKPTNVGDCTDNAVAFVQNDTDLKSVIDQLSRKDVVLVIGRDKRLQGIVTAWDLAEEFADLVDPFKRIGEIEERLRTLISRRIGTQNIAAFLKRQRLSEDDPIPEIGELTMGELERVLQFPEHWNTLKLAYDRGVFIEALAEARGYRNRLMHFRDPLTKSEMINLAYICDMVREIPIT